MKRRPRSAGPLLCRDCPRHPCPCGKICGILPESLREGPIFSSCQPLSRSGTWINSLFINRKLVKLRSAPRVVPIRHALAGQGTFPQLPVNVYSQRLVQMVRIGAREAMPIRPARCEKAPGAAISAALRPRATPPGTPPGEYRPCRCASCASCLLSVSRAACVCA